MPFHSRSNHICTFSQSLRTDVVGVCAAARQEWKRRSTADRGGFLRLQLAKLSPWRWQASCRVPAYHVDEHIVEANPDDHTCLVADGLGTATCHVPGRHTVSTGVDKSGSIAQWKDWLLAPCLLRYLDLNSARGYNAVGASNNLEILLTSLTADSDCNQTGACWSWTASSIARRSAGCTEQ